MFLIIVMIAVVVFIFKWEDIKTLLLKFKYMTEDEKTSGMFFSKKLNDEFENNNFLFKTISGINQNQIDSVDIYVDRMEIDNKVVSFYNIGMEQLQNVGECKALAYYIQSNLYNKKRYEVSEISDLYATKYQDNAIGYSVVDKDKKYNRL